MNLKERFVVCQLSSILLFPRFQFDISARNESAKFGGDEKTDVGTTTLSIRRRIDKRFRFKLAVGAIDLAMELVTKELTAPGLIPKRVQVPLTDRAYF